MRRLKVDPGAQLRAAWAFIGIGIGALFIVFAYEYRVALMLLPAGTLVFAGVLLLLSCREVQKTHYVYAGGWKLTLGSALFVIGLSSPFIYLMIFSLLAR